MATLRPVREWQGLLEGAQAPLAARLHEAHDDAPYRAEALAMYRAALQRFADRYGASTPVYLVRSPGRVNCLGTHIDHRGGPINPIAIREMVMAVAPAADDRIDAVNVDDVHFPEGTFAISEELPAGPVEDWEAWTREAMRRHAGEDPKRNWLNYIRASVLYLANRQRLLDGTNLRGMNLCLGSSVPIAAGLSSSSALVVAAALATIAVNRLEIDRYDLVRMCGEAEWFVGTRGGMGDHAAILCGEAGAVLHIGFFPLTVDHAFLRRGYRIVMANTLKEAKKQAGAKDGFNQRVAGYVIGQFLLKKRWPQHAPRIEHLRDVNPYTLGVSEADIYRMLQTLPVRVTRDELKTLLPDPQVQAQLARLYQTHSEPANGYPVRQVTLYAVSEIARSRMALHRLKAQDMAAFGELMNLSHEGDRVTELVGGKRAPVDHTMDDGALCRLAEQAASVDPVVRERAALWRQPGGYDASCLELDEIVDIARAQPGVLGAGLSGAGLGGCAVILVADAGVAGLTKALTEEYYKPHNLPPAVELCVPVEGASILDV